MLPGNTSGAPVVRRVCGWTRRKLTQFSRRMSSLMRPPANRRSTAVDKSRYYMKIGGIAQSSFTKHALRSMKRSSAKLGGMALSRSLAEGGPFRQRTCEESLRAQQTFAFQGERP
jgi:hypothetical protein